MFTQWVGKNVDLTLLEKYIEDFFRSKGLEIVRKEDVEGGRKIFVMPRRSSNIRGDINVTIKGQPSNFVIEFVAGEKARSLTKLGSLLALLGGGVFVLEGLKVQEALEKLEGEFWICVEDVISRLIDSA